MIPIHDDKPLPRTPLALGKNPEPAGGVKIGLMPWQTLIDKQELMLTAAEEQKKANVRHI